MSVMQWRKLIFSLIFPIKRTTDQPCPVALGHDPASPVIYYASISVCVLSASPCLVSLQDRRTELCKNPAIVVSRDGSRASEPIALSNPMGAK